MTTSNGKYTFNDSFHEILLCITSNEMMALTKEYDALYFNARLESIKLLVNQ